MKKKVIIKTVHQELLLDFISVFFIFSFFVSLHVKQFFKSVISYLSLTCILSVYSPKTDATISRYIRLYCLTGSSLVSITISVRLLKLDLKKKERTLLN